MVEKKLKVNDAHELLSVPYHDYKLVEFSFSEDRGSVRLQDPTGKFETKIVAKNPVEYNITDIFPDSIVGEVFLFELETLQTNTTLLRHANHVIGGRLREQDIHGFIGKLNENRQYKLLILSTVNGGQISVISSEIASLTSE